MPAHQIVVDALEAAGFVADPDQYVPDPALSDNGPYEVLARLQRNGVKVMIEQNTVQSTTYPAVAIVEHGDARVACNAEDVELILAVVADLGG